MSDALKQQAAAAALQFIPSGAVLGVGTGSTVNALIALLPGIRHKIEACISSSAQTTAALKALNFQVVDANSVSAIDVYIDGADEVDPYKNLIKGGGAALTGEKIVASLAKQFICIVDEKKCVDVLGKFALPVEVIPLARSLVARKLVELGGFPVYREGVVTDYGNVILDVHHLQITNPIALEATIKALTGVVENGIFAKNKADKVIVARQSGVEIKD